MPPGRTKDAIIAELKKELEAVRLEDRSTKSELSKAKIDLDKKDTIVKDLQKMFSEGVQFHVGCRKRKKKHGKAGMMEVADKETKACLDRCSVLVSNFLWLIIKVMPGAILVTGSKSDPQSLTLDP
jgi:hypothetical protein